MFPNIPIMALTATATERVQRDIVINTRLRNPLIIVSSFNRPNLQYNVHKKTSWRQDLVPDLIGDCCCIVYCLTRKETESIAALLGSLGIKCAAYHAGLSLHTRTHVHHSFMRDELQCIVATVAFAMGIDKPVKNL